MTSSTSFARAARATYQAAVALHGEGSPEAAAVESAWGLTGSVLDLVAPEVTIGSPADGAAVATPTVITASATDNVALSACWRREQETPPATPARARRSRSPW